MTTLIQSNSRSMQPVLGQVYYDMTTNSMKVYTGTKWVDISTAPGILSIKKDMICDTVMINDVQYYRVNLIGYNLDEVYDWTIEVFGTPGERWLLSGGRFLFAKPKDYDWFVIRWSA